MVTTRVGVLSGLAVGVVQLGQDPALAQAVKLGTLDITVNGPVLQQYVPSLAVMDLPFLFRTLTDAHKWQDGSVGAKIKVQSPRAMEGHPCACASVGV